MKTLCALLVFCLLPFAAAADSVITSHRFDGYTVSVEESGASLRVSAGSANPYGYRLVSSGVGNTTVDGQRVKRIRLTFDVAPELNPLQPIKASDVYSIKFSKGTVIQKVLITIRTGNLTAAADQVIWDRAAAQAK